MTDNSSKAENGGKASFAAALSTGKEIKKKGFMLLISVVLLISAAVYLTVAWYTKMTAVTTTEFDVAQWDFRANYQIDSVYASVYRYSNVNNNKAAPGTGGYIPVVLSADQSDVDVEYVITMSKESLSEEMQKRLIFYYRNGDTEPAYRVGYDETTGQYQTGYSADTLVRFDEATAASPRALAGTITRGTAEKKVQLFWRWVYDADEAYKNGLISTKPEEAEITAWDEYDTKVGKNPDAYEEDMKATIKIVGAQIRPDLETILPNPT